MYGEPGSGKTFVLKTLAAQGWGYFTTTDQLDRISGDIRRMQPRVLIVDDAHVSPEFLTKLRHLRSEMHSEFRIVASTWPGDKGEVVAQLGIGNSQALRLERLTRDEIVEVILGCGIAGPDGLVQEIVNQSEGLPGLAVTLCQLCKGGAVREVAIGEALNREVSTTFRRLVGDTAMQILACFAVGGEAGMPQSAVASATGLPGIEIHSQITLLAAGGVVHEVAREQNGESIVKVRPDTLREALVRDIFFGNRVSPPFNPLFEQAPDHARAIETLIGAKHLGGRIDQDRLEPLVAGVFESGSARSEQIARDFAAFGKRESLWILELYPDIAAKISDSLLHIVPDQILPFLLGSAVGDNRPLHQHPSHPDVPPMFVPIIMRILLSS